MVAGLLLMRFGIAPGGALYDAQLHAVFLGFVFSMIFAHAPIVLPALTGLTLGYRRRFYTHLVLLHASLAIRVAGDLLFSLPLRQWGGLINGVAILLFMLNTAAAVRGGNQEDPQCFSGKRRLGASPRALSISLLGALERMMEP